MLMELAQNPLAAWKLIEFLKKLFFLSRLLKYLKRSSLGEVKLNLCYLHRSKNERLSNRSYVYLSKKHSLLNVAANSLSYPLVPASISSFCILSSSSTISFCSSVWLNLYCCSIILTTSSVGMVINASIFWISSSSLGLVGFLLQEPMIMSYSKVSLVMSSP